MHRIYEAGYPQGEIGYVYILDWETKEPLGPPIEIVPHQPPEGKSHGSRGITIHRDQLWVATSGDNILVFDLDTFRFREDIRHPNWKRLHQIKSRQSDGTMHVVSTGNDTLFRMGGPHSTLTDLSTQSELLEPHIIQRTREDQWGNDMLHFNSVGWAPNGDEHHVYYNCNMIFNWTRQQIVALNGPLHRPHDLAFVEDGFFVNSSADKTCLFYKWNGEIRVVNKNLEVPPPGIPNNTGYTHGLAIGDDTLFACASPTKICAFEKVEPFHHIETFHLNNAPNECIYDLVLDPRDWSI
jgi:hypothetical protein